MSAGLHPHTIETLRTLAHGYGMEVVEVPLRDGVTDPDAWAEAIDGDTSAAIFAQPNFYGAVEDAAALSAAAKAAGSTARVEGRGAARGRTRSRACGGGTGSPRPGRGRPGGRADARDPRRRARAGSTAVGEGQPLGNRLDFGGPSFGFAAREEYLRRMPGRIAGETVDVDGRRGFVLTLQTREQHIRREKATSNICTAQALNALAGVVYISRGSGRRGIVELGSCCSLAPTTREKLGIEGVEKLHDSAGHPRVRAAPRRGCRRGQAPLRRAGVNPVSTAGD